MVFLFIALKIEASPIINYYKLKKIQFNLFENKDISLRICGVGEKNFLSSIPYFKIYQNDKIINFGICGAKSKNFKIGEIINISKVQNCEKSYILQKSSNIKNLTLQTFQNPIQNSYNLNCDVVDMEAFGFFEYFKNFNKNIKIIKIISDHLCFNIPKKEFIYGIINQKMDILDREIYGK